MGSAPRAWTNPYPIDNPPAVNKNRAKVETYFAEATTTDPSINEAKAT